jgi:hypothetical protein
MSTSNFTNTTIYTPTRTEFIQQYSSNELALRYAKKASCKSSVTNYIQSGFNPPHFREELYYLTWSEGREATSMCCIATEAKERK